MSVYSTTYATQAGVRALFALLMSAAVACDDASSAGRERPDESSEPAVADAANSVDAVDDEEACAADCGDEGTGNVGSAVDGGGLATAQPDADVRTSAATADSSSSAPSTDAAGSPLDAGAVQPSDADVSTTDAQQAMDGQTDSGDSSADTGAAQCALGQEQCLSNPSFGTHRLERCDDAGVWQFVTSCHGGCGDGGACFTCVPGQRWCNARDPVVCSDRGVLETMPACESACRDGACVVGECTPDTGMCTDGYLQTCGFDGRWGARRYCFDGCLNGACTHAVECDQLAGCCSTLPSGFPARTYCFQIAANSGRTGCLNVRRELQGQGECL